MEHTAVGAGQVPLPQTLGQHGAEGHPEAGAEGDHQGLDGVGVGEGEKGLAADLGHKDAVHQIVDRLHQHGQHDGPGHVEHQPAEGHGAEDVGLFHRGVLLT